MDDYDQFLALHELQLKQSNVPEHFWKSVHRKLSGEIYDAGSAFTMYQTSDGWCVQMSRESPMSATDPENIFLVDHAWTFGSTNQAREHLLGVPGFLERMEALVEVEEDSEEESDDEDSSEDKTPEEGEDQQSSDAESVHSRAEKVIQALWPFAHVYRLAGLAEEDQHPIWYLLDEFGSRVQHSDSPSFCLVPFVYAPTQMAFSLLWPLSDVEPESEVTHDYAHGVKEPLLRAARLAPWFPERMQNLVSAEPSCLAPDSAAKISERCGETLPTQGALTCPRHCPLKVFTDLELLESFLTRSEFSFTENQEEADILWITDHFKDFAGLARQERFVFINQFPCENVVTCKDLLVSTSRKACAGSTAGQCTGLPGLESPVWLPESYNMVTELPQLVARYQAKEAAKEDNYWICKPWNLGRSLDIHITDNLAHLILLSSSGPKVASRYLSRPVLFDRRGVGQVKFDYRYVVLLKSVRPLELYAYKVFWIRFANEAFKLAKFDNYETHFTVMNYFKEGSVLHQVHCEDFVPLFNEQYPQIGWQSVEEATFKAIRELFEAAIADEPPAGIGASVHSRSLYALDVMVEWEGEAEQTCMKPQILEVNFSPDCVRACKYHPQFFNHVFQTLFLDSVDDCPVTRIC